MHFGRIWHCASTIANLPWHGSSFLSHMPWEHLTLHLHHCIFLTTRVKFPYLHVSSVFDPMPSSLLIYLSAGQVFEPTHLGHI